MGYEIHTEAKRGHSRQVEQLAIEAMDALQLDDGTRAERLLGKALELEPNSPYLLQGRDKEGEDLIRQIHERFPDYLFGRANLARFCARDGELDRAQALLEPLLSLRRLHVTEFSALCAAEIELLLARGETDGARAWFEMWERAAPDDPNVNYFRPRLKGGWLRRMLPW